jgi:hypothetical protein
VLKDHEEALKWYRLAADQGHAKAQWTVGYYIQHGVGSYDPDEILRWFRLAADQDYAEAYVALGDLYSDDAVIGVSYNPAEGSRWYNLAAERGYASAQYHLATMLIEGVPYPGSGVAKNISGAAELFRLAAEQGHSVAMYNVGMNYYHGHGVSKNNVNACAWVAASVEFGCEEGASAESLLAQEMSAKEITEAEKQKKEIVQRIQEWSKNEKYKYVGEDGIFVSAEQEDDPARSDNSSLEEGIYTFPDGREYKGELKDGVPHGSGIETWTTGSQYDGEFRNGKRHGQGTFIWGEDSDSRGDKYVGEWRDGKRHGQGVLESGDYQYKGNFENDKYDGKGTRIYVSRPFPILQHPLGDGAKPSTKRENSGCFIATAVLGSHEDPVVQELRKFRDDWLLKKPWGNKFVTLYYRYGPIAAKYIESNLILKRLARFFIVRPAHLLSKLICKL